MRGQFLALLITLATLDCVALDTVPVWPTPDSTNSPTPEYLSVAVNNNTDNAVVTFLYRKALPPVRSNFTIVAMPDTQNYCESRLGGLPDMFFAQTDWIRTNRESHNIIFACQLGDCVQTPDWEYEWIIATNALYRLEDPVSTGLNFGIPYALTVGNHDGPPTTLYNKYFGTSHFEGKPYYGGHATNGNDNSFVLFSSADMDFIAVMLQYAAGPDALAWANSVLATNMNRRAIIISHSILHPDVTAPVFNLQGQPIYDALKQNTNIFLMLCGHEPQFGRRFDTYNNNTIISVLSDYENDTNNGGNGWMRVMEFVPSSNRINVKTYSPWLDDYKTNIYNQFSLPYNMSLDGSFTTASVTSTNASSFVTQSGVLTNITPATTYEWFVSVRNSQTNVTSQVWRFTTAAAAVPPPPFKILSLSHGTSGAATFSWNSVGGTRYRVQYSDALPGGSFSGDFIDIVRPDTVEIDASTAGTYSVQVFTDDFTYTGGPPVYGARFFRIRTVQ